jgi:hypothetical protein
VVYEYMDENARKERLGTYEDVEVLSNLEYWSESYVLQRIPRGSTMESRWRSCNFLRKHHKNLQTI